MQPEPCPLTGRADGGHALGLHAPLIVAAAGYVIAASLAWFATRPERR
jgi:hypothetical protein